EVKRNSVDGSVGLPHVRVEHRQALNLVFSFLKRRRQKLREPVCKSGLFLVLTDTNNVLIWLSR
ncbi:hypothetical protein, partial [Vibrio alginolyticus]|uniref:hypothetical protein n=1 Tax=Vibrio alginolyticus TaxID=663 RepID=UPI0040675DF4